jgi:hypothetical protein
MAKRYQNMTAKVRRDAGQVGDVIWRLKPGDEAGGSGVGLRGK